MVAHSVRNRFAKFAPKFQQNQQSIRSSMSLGSMKKDNLTIGQQQRPTTLTTTKLSKSNSMIEQSRILDSSIPRRQPTTTLFPLKCNIQRVATIIPKIESTQKTTDLSSAILNGKKLLKN